MTDNTEQEEFFLSLSDVLDNIRNQMLSLGPTAWIDSDECEEFPVNLLIPKPLAERFRAAYLVFREVDKAKLPEEKKGVEFFDGLLTSLFADIIYNGLVMTSIKLDLKKNPEKTIAGFTKVMESLAAKKEEE